MDGIKKEYEEDLCHGCLSADRNLSPLTNYELFFTILGNKQSVEEYKYLNIPLCWECHALLWRTMLFRQRLQQAQYALSLVNAQQISTNSLSSLQYSHKQDFDCYIEECIQTKPDIDLIIDNSPGIDVKLEFKEDSHEIDNIEFNFSDYCQNYSDTSQNFSDTCETEKDIDFKQPPKKKKNYNELREKTKMQKIDNSIDLKYLDKEDKYEIDHIESNYSDTCQNEKDVDNKPPTKKKKKYKQGRRTQMQKIDANIDLKKLDNYFTEVCLSEKEVEAILAREREEDASRPYKCKVCGFQFGSKPDLYSHRKNMHRRCPTIGKCPHCSFTYKTPWDLELHRWRLHGAFRCTLCGALVARSNCRSRHLRLHSRRYRCLDCNVEFDNRQLSAYHEKELHSKYMCDHCTHVSGTKKSLVKHMTRHHLPNKCQDCGLIFPTWDRLRRHTREYHERSGAPDAYCVECDIMFATPAKYKRHLSQSARHRNKKKIRVPCPECGKTFSRPYYMRNHMKLFHTKQSRHHCQLCDKYFINGFVLRSHFKFVHQKMTLPKNKVCSVCGRAFATNRILTNHMRTHTGERPFVCTHCPAAFAQKVALKAHLAAIHKEK